MSHSPHRPRCCSQWGWEPLSCPNQTLRSWGLRIRNLWGRPFGTLLPSIAPAGLTFPQR